MIDDKSVESAALLKSIGHPIRIKIIRALTHHSSMTVTELSAYLSIDQPIMSLHLGVLRKCNVIKAIKSGKQSFYSISDISTKQIVNIAYHIK